MEVRERGPLSVPFDRTTTFNPVGQVNDSFVREVGIYMWRNIPFDKRTWKKVDEDEREALNAHLRVTYKY